MTFTPATGPGFTTPQTLNQRRRLRANRAPVHQLLRRLRAASCGLAATANSSPQRPDSLQPSGIWESSTENGGGGKVLEISVASDPTASRGAIWEKEQPDGRRRM
jgi:hypothetical protein